MNVLLIKLLMSNLNKLDKLDKILVTAPRLGDLKEIDDYNGVVEMSAKSCQSPLRNKPSLFGGGGRGWFGNFLSWGMKSFFSPLVSAFFGGQ